MKRRRAGKIENRGIGEYREGKEINDTEGKWGKEGARGKEQREGDLSRPISILDFGGQKPLNGGRGACVVCPRWDRCSPLCKC